MSRKLKRRKMAIEADEADAATAKATAAAIRNAKKGARPGKITEPLKPANAGKSKSKSRSKPGSGDADGKKKRVRVGGGKGSAFDEGGKGGYEGMRAKQTKVNLNKKGGKKAGGGGGKGKVVKGRK